MPAASTIIDGCVWIATSGGTGSFVELVPTAGYQTMEAAGALDQQQFSYRAQSGDLSQWEIGTGIWTASTKTLTRVVLFNSLATTAAINFATPPQILITALASDIQAPPIPPLANGDLSFFVNPATGNDANPGTSGAPFQTIQRAVDVVLRYNYQNSHIATIQLADGNYNLTAPVFIGPVINGDFSRTFRIFGNFTTFSNVQVTLDAHDPFIFACPIQEWAVVGMQINSANGAGILAYNASNVITDNIVFNVGDAAIEAVGNGTIVQASIWNNGQSSFIKATARSFAFATQGGECDLFNSTITFQNSPAFSDAFFRVFEGGIGLLQNMTYVNGGTVTGPKYDFERNGIFNGDLTNLPGTLAGSFADNSALFDPVLFSGTFYGLTQVFGAIPTATDVPAGCWVIAKDTGGGGVYVLVNDGGTIKKVQLT